MIPLILLVLIQMNRVLTEQTKLDPEQMEKLDKFVDLIEQNELKIHNGIASGRYDAEDKHDEEETEDDNYGKFLLQDMVNFRKVKIPGVDYDLVPILTPVEVADSKEIDEESKPQEDDPHEEGPPKEGPPEEGPPDDEGPPPPEHNSENSESPPTIESEDTPPPGYDPKRPPTMHPKDYSHEEPPPNEEAPVNPPDVDHHHHNHHYHHRHHFNGDKSRNPINILEEKSNENIPENKMSEFKERVRNPLPPLTPTSYGVSENLLNNQENIKNNGFNDDQHSGTLPHSHPIDENEGNEKTNEDNYHSYKEHNSPDSHLNPNEGPPLHSNYPPVSDHSDYNRQKQENYETRNLNVRPKPLFFPKRQYYPIVQKQPINSEENPDYNPQPIDYNHLPFPIPLLPRSQASPPIIEPESPNDPEPQNDAHSQNDDNQNQQNNLQQKRAEVGGEGDQIMKYYEDQSKVDSKRYARLAATQPKTEPQVVKTEELNRFENYKNTNGPQVIDENKRINKRIGLSSNPDLEHKGYYYPTDYVNPTKQYNEEPTSGSGSREYQNSQEYHSYEPNATMYDDEGPPSSDELKSYDEWAGEHLKFAQDKFKSDDHPNHNIQRAKSNSDNNQYNRNRNDQKEGNKGLNQNSRSVSLKDYERSRPRIEEESHTPQHPPQEPHSRPSHHHHSHNGPPHQHPPHRHPQQPEEEQSHDPHDEHHPDSADEQEHDEHEHEHETELEETPPNHYHRYPNRSKPSKTQKSYNDEDDYHNEANVELQREHNNERHSGPHTGPKTERIPQILEKGYYKNQNNENSNRKPEENLEYDIDDKTEKQTTRKLDSLIPQNMSGIEDNYQDYDNQNGQEMHENESPERSRSEDESHQSSTSPRDMEDDQQEYEEQNKRQHSKQYKHSAHNQHKQPSLHSHRSDPSQSNKSDKTSMNKYNNNQNNDRTPNGDYYRLNTNSRHREPEDRLVANQRSNDGYYNHNRNQRKPNQYLQQQQHEDGPQIRPYSGRRQQYYDEEKAASADTSAQKADPITGILLNDKSQKVLTQTNSSVNANNDNQTLAIESIDSFSSWAKPLSLKTRLIVIDDRNDTQVLENESSKTNTNREEKEVKQNSVSSKRKDSRNITRKPKIESKIRDKNTINSVNISNKNQNYDLIINPNNKSEYILKPSNPKTINQQLVRTIRTRPQSYMGDNAINFEMNSVHLNHNQLSQNTQNSWPKSLPNISTHIRNRSSESSITEPKCAERSQIKNFCFESDEEYPLESIRQNLIRNLENLRSVHRRLNSSVTNDRYYEPSIDSLDNSCRAHKLTIRPLRAKNINGQWKVVPNIDNLFEQRITLRNCSEEHKECATDGQKYFTTKCVQNYILNELITYNTESSDFEIDIFLVPNVCSCSSPKTNII